MNQRLTVLGILNVDPTYRLDPNPIEMMFAKLMIFVRKAEDRTAETIWRRLAQLFTALTPPYERVKNYLRRAVFGSK
ncbi:hypothetical protein DXT89_23255 [Agrobacterium vitis]|uniref:Transposase n=1 Tax=Agrobacterium vitis TaxID=373 RepID=A0A368NWC2_AGRVI|nr:hypothetical protein DXM22_22480 [Agrobacterium vitis]KAA3521883.1 hypothetical protein DXT89_23255 [Agrobacterium vitis]RCU54877.1 hypothetical protein ASB66_007715 [Agrobacterium vitis]